MKTILKYTSWVWYTPFLLLFLTACPNPNPQKPPEQGQPSGEGRAKEIQVEPNHAKGGKYKPYAPPKELEPNKDKPYQVPDGPKRGDMKPESTEFKIEKIHERGGGGGADDPVVFGTYNAFGTTVTGVSATAADMSVARNGDVVLVSGNWYAALSTDGGNTFTGLDPTTIMPVFDNNGNPLDGGWCCDQVIQYVPRFDMFVWLHQFCGNGAGGCLSGTNRIRIAVASTQEMVSSGGTTWTYWDFTSAIMGGQTNPFDYPDMSVGDNNLYWSADVVGVGLMTVRVPLSELSARTTVHCAFTNPSDGATAYGAHLTQNTGNEIFWAGHVNSSTLRVFSLLEGSNTYFWRDIGINSWPNGQPSSTSPDGATDWLSFNFPQNAVIGSARSGSNVWFAWTAKSGGGFARAHIQMVRINVSNYTKQEQVQIWNPDFAFGYPYLSTDGEKGELGISLAFGGGNTFYASHAVGIWGDFIVWYPALSDIATARWGDYTTVRRANPNAQLWDAAGYTVQKNAAGNAQFQPHYIQFGRNSVFVHQ